MRTLLLAASLLLATPAVAAEAKPIVEDSTGVKFDAVTTVEGTQYRCLGAGVRKVFLFKAYAVTYCLEEGKVDDAIVGYLQKNHPDKKGEALEEALATDQRFFNRLANAPGDKLVVMRLVRDISKDKIAGAFRDSLGDVLPKEKVEKLIDTIPGDGKDGQRILLHSHGDKLVIDIAGNARTIEDQEIASKLWRVWLGPESPTPTLKESIASQVAMRVNP
ncbi:hypothetical protein [Vulgatibacter sp.]|uniref:hypothetical protein n=1 Tax=Vulgatibacter sp. TaxID=1971226 RepID=UPI0035625F7C